ncbi:MAG: ATP-binding protein [Bryobacteraceae bacterium]|jgi:two-component system sensor histidine kinase KdpD
MDGKIELVTDVATQPAAGTRANRWTNYRRAARVVLGIWRGCFAGLAAVALVTFGAFRLHLNLSTTGSLYFLIVVMVSVIWGFWEASVTSLVAVNCLNYFFVPPVLTWRVSDPQNWVALATFEITALTVSRLSTRVQGQARVEARQRMEIEKLYELSRRILLLDRRTIGPQVVALIQEIFGTESAALFDATLARLDATGSRANDLEQLARGAYFQDSTLEGQSAHASAHVLRLGSRPVGAIAICGPEVGRLTMASIASLAAIALERARSFETESRAEAARQTEQLRTAVLDSLAHAFKTPLTAIRTASSGLLEAGRLSRDDLEMAALIDERAEHLNRLTTELLQMAKIDAAEVRLRRERISVLTLIEDAVERHREQLHGRRIDVSDSASYLDVWGDRAILGMALDQFIDNASKYSTPGSSISVIAGENLGEIVIAVHNDGPPIQPADRERIFERFYRAEDSRHRAPGTGLGLSIAKKAAEAHDGRTWVISGEPGGTTFFFALPRGIKAEIRRQSGAVARQGSDR